MKKEMKINRGIEMINKKQTKQEQTEDFSPLKKISTLETIYDRKKLLEITACLIDNTYTRLSVECFQPREGDRERLAYIKIIKELISLYARILEDANAPAWEGLPEEEDIELAAAKKKLLNMMERSTFNLQSKD
jgi:hypothetical protein